MIIPGNIDIMVIRESKLDDSFPSSQFLIDGYAEPFRRDRNVHGGGILIYVRSDIPCQQLNNHRLPDEIECLFLELNFRKCKFDYIQSQMTIQLMTTQLTIYIVK